MNIPKDNIIDIALFLKEPLDILNFSCISKQIRDVGIFKNINIINYLTEIKEQLASIQQDGCAIKYIKEPSEKVQMVAVQQNGWAIQFIKNPSEKVQLAAVK